mmetsp:Transcript_25668/g.64679  ORF Transcript_25668/g.64679 Transcript_25668/m.64679 type:complete len:158 (-) Transcript_25668:381-854(-)
MVEPKLEAESRKQKSTSTTAWDLWKDVIVKKGMQPLGNLAGDGMRKAQKQVAKLDDWKHQYSDEERGACSRVFVQSGRPMYRCMAVADGLNVLAPDETSLIPNVIGENQLSSSVCSWKCCGYCTGFAQYKCKTYTNTTGSPVPLAADLAPCGTEGVY